MRRQVASRRGGGTARRGRAAILDECAAVVSRPAVGLLATYIVVAVAIEPAGITASGNAINTVSAVILGGVVLAAAFTQPHLSAQLLRGNDVSYGLYLYHGPIMNTALAMRLDLAPVAIATLVLLASVITAVLSWQLAERPALRGKHLTVRRPLV